MKRPVSMTRKPATTTYEDWMKGEGIPIVEDWGIEDVKALDRKPWARTGGKGAFIHLKGMKHAITGMYVMEVAPEKALNPEKHLYEEMIYILKGQGATEIWQEGQSKRTFEWGEGSFFAPPINTWHRLYNVGREPVRALMIFRPGGFDEMLDDLHRKGALGEGQRKAILGRWGVDFLEEDE